MSFHLLTYIPHRSWWYIPWYISRNEIIKTLNEHLVIIFKNYAVMNFMTSHYIEVAQEDIFMEQKMWFGLTGFGPVGNTKEKFGAIISNFWERVFSCFGEKIEIFENVVASALKSLHNINLRFLLYIFFAPENIKTALK